MMTKWRRAALAVSCVVSLAVFSLVGCGSKETADPGSESAVDAVIGISVLTSDNPFFDELANALRDEAAKHNYDVIITAGQQDPELQDQQVDDFIIKGVDAIVLCPCDSRAVGTTIEKANSADIPVFTADIASLSDTGKVVCHVATDNLGGGRAAAQAVIEMLDGQGEVAVLNHPKIESAILREQGFMEEIKKAPGITVVATLFGGGERKASYDSTKDVLQPHPNLNGIFCINDPSAMGAITALKEVGAAGRVQVVGFDAQPEACRAVKEGKLYATIVQYPTKIGQTTADVIHQHLVGKEVESEVLIPVTTYRKAEADADPMLAEEAAE